MSFEDRLSISMIFTGVPFLVMAGLVLLMHALLRFWAKSQPMPGRLLNLPLSFLVSAVLGYLTWWMWMSWDLGHYTAADGRLSGPYRVWQVAACALMMVAVVVAVGMWSRWVGTGPFAAAYGAAFGFSFAYAYWASDDETGQAGFGIVLVVLGTIMGLSVVASVVAGVKAARGG